MKEKENSKNNNSKEEKIEKKKETKKEIKKEDLKEENIEEQNEGSYLKGIAGAIIGGIVGLIPWILVYVYGNMMLSALAIIIAACEFYGYKMLKGKIDKKLPLIILAVAIVLISVTVWFIIPAILISKYGLAVNADTLKLLYSNSEFVSGLTRDFLISAVFTLLGAGAVSGNLKRQLKNGQKDNLTIDLDASIVEGRKAAIDTVKPIFEKYEATSKEKTIMKEEVIAEIEDQSKANQYFTVLKSAKIIKKYKGQYYYDESGEANKDLKTAKKTRMIAIIVIIVIALLLALISNTETFLEVDNGIFKFQISNKWKQPYEYTDEYGYEFFQYISTTPRLEESNGNTELAETNFQNRPASIQVLIEAYDPSIVSSIEDLKTIMEGYIQESTLIKEYKIETGKTANGYDYVEITIMPDSDQDSYEKDYILLNGAFAIDVIATSYSEKDIDTLNKDAKHIAESLQWIIDVNSINLDTVNEIEE